LGEQVSGDSFAIARQGVRPRSIPDPTRIRILRCLREAEASKEFPSAREIP
jgi:hypothetical protein